MTYSITKSDATLLTAIPDGSIDQTTSLTLIGKNTSGFGTFVNENFVYLLENFANTTSPNSPITGQLWFDLIENRLKVYDASGSWKVSGGTIVSSSVPTLTAGDLWIDSLREQLYFSDGLNTLLAGPIYTASQGISGFQTDDVIDSNNISHTIVSLYVGQILIGVYNKDSAFTLSSNSSIAGIATVGKGFTAANIPGLIFDQLVTRSTALQTSDGTLKTAADFVSTSSASLMTGTLTIANAVPLKLGIAGNVEFDVTPASGFAIKSVVSNQNFLLQLKDGANATTDAIHAVANTHQVGIYNSNPQATLHIGTDGGANGSVIIEGNLTVKGTTTSTSTLNISLADYTLTLANTVSPTDSTADGAGVIIAGTTNKSFLYNSASTSLQSSENINLVPGKTYKINGQTVLSGSSLGSGINSAPGLTSIGSLTTLQAAYINITGNTISYVNAGQTTGNIVLAPLNGSVDVNTSKIVQVGNPTNPDDAANKTYVDSSILSITQNISLPTASFNGNTALIASTYLNKIFPSTEHGENCACRVVSVDEPVIRLFRLIAGSWQYIQNL
jgi:hypothetical protein